MIEEVFRQYTFASYTGDDDNDNTIDNRGENNNTIRRASVLVAPARYLSAHSPTCVLRDTFIRLPIGKILEYICLNDEFSCLLRKRSSKASQNDTDHVSFATVRTTELSRNWLWSFSYSHSL
jgi:hypothetical protein